MRSKRHPDFRCTYIVSIDDASAAAGDLRLFSEYLMELSLARCEVIVLDASPADLFEQHQRVLRWTSRHVAASPGFDLIHVAAELASADKIIVASEEVRCDGNDLHRLCGLLDVHEVVETEEYFDPMPWWAGIDAGSVLVQRALEPNIGHSSLFGLRRSALRPLRREEGTVAPHPVRRLSQIGAEVFSAADLFVRRRPPSFDRWIRQRGRAAEIDLATPAKSAFFFALLPLAVLLALAGGILVASGYAAAIAFVSIALGFRGRHGAAALFPLSACCFAPLWVFERSVAIYFALARRFRSTVLEPAGTAAAPSSGKRAASGE